MNQVDEVVWARIAENDLKEIIDFMVFGLKLIMIVLEKNHNPPIELILFTPLLIFRRAAIKKTYSQNAALQAL